MGAVFVDDSFHLAGVGPFRETFFHAADIFGGVPENVVLSADEKQFSVDVLNLDCLGFRDGMSSLGIVEKLSGVEHISGAPGLYGDDLPIFGMLIEEGHVGERLAVVGKEGFSFDGPFLAAVFFALHEALPDEIAGRHGDGEGQLGKIRSRGQSQRSGGGGSCDGKPAVSGFFSHLMARSIRSRG